MWCHEMFAIQYRLTFGLYMHSLCEVRLYCPSTISVMQPDVMSTSWNELIRRFRCVRSPLTWYINFSFVHLQYITSYVRSYRWSLVIVRDNYSCLVILLFFSSPTKFSGQPRNLYRYGPQVDLRTLTHFQWPWPTSQGHRPIFVPKTRNFKSI